MPRAARQLLQRISGALLAGRRDGGLLEALQSELQHELSAARPEPSQTRQNGKVGDFVLEWNNPKTQDLVLKRRSDSGEEMAVSALLGPLIYQGEDVLPRHALMKVCVKKPDFDPILQFDCKVFSRGDEGSEFAIKKVQCLTSTCSVRASRYKGPMFSHLDDELKGELKEYLVVRGIDVGLTNFLLQHLRRNEQGQYVNWLHKLENLFTEDA